MDQVPGEWDFTKTEVLEEETQIRSGPDGLGPAPPEKTRIYYRAAKISAGFFLEFEGGMRVPVGERIRVGRNFFNEVVVFGDPHVSRRHAEVGDKDGKLYLIDLGSRNGTYLNGRALPGRKESPLAIGDTILLGASVEATVGAFPTESADEEPPPRGETLEDTPS